MVHHAIDFILIALLIFTPIAYGSMDFWAFSLMELAVLLIIALWAAESVVVGSRRGPSGPELRTPNSKLQTVQGVLLLCFLGLVAFQMVPLPLDLVRVLSPKSYELRSFLLAGFPAGASFLNLEPSLNRLTLSLMPFPTQMEFFKWLALAGLFLFLLHRDLQGRKDRALNRFLLILFLVGVLESLYGMFEVFSGHNQSLGVTLDDASVAGTFISRNYFAGYLLMVVPLSIGTLLARRENETLRFGGWRHWLTSLHGKSLLLGFGVIVMILALFFSASRMGIASLLFSCSLTSLLLRNVQGGRRASRVPIVVLVLALLWAGWIGLDAVASRFFTSSDDFESRWRVWVDTFRIVKDFPLFGSGLGTFAMVFPLYRSFHLVQMTNHAENDFLQLASEVGLVGAGLLLILFVTFFYKAVSGIRSLPEGDGKRYIGIGGLVGILALMLHSLVEANIQIPANAFLFAFLFGTMLRLPDFSKSNRRPSRT